MGKSPAFQFYPNDWLSSQKIMFMTPAQEGGYIRLLCYAWNDPDCSIPADLTACAILARFTEHSADWQADVRVVQGCFDKHPNRPDRLVNLRLIEERKKQEEWREKSKEGGIKSGETRRNQSKGGSTIVPKGGSTKHKQMVEHSSLLISSQSHLNSSLNNSSPTKELTTKKHHVPTPEASELAAYLRTLILAHTPNARITDSAFCGWQTDADRLLRIDKRDVKEAKDLLRWVHEISDFWRPNIMSMSKFREKYDQLWNQARRDAQKHGGNLSGIQEWLRKKEAGEPIL